MQLWIIVSLLLFVYTVREAAEKMIPNCLKISCVTKKTHQKLRN